MLVFRCSLRDLKPQIAAAFSVVDEEMVRAVRGWQRGSPSDREAECTITSCWRQYSSGSLHPYGYAADADSPGMPELPAQDDPEYEPIDELWQLLRKRVAYRLGDEFDVLAHAVEGGRIHLHWEWDPRTRPAPSPDVVHT